jgi:hypothetical protein
VFDLDGDLSLNGSTITANTAQSSPQGGGIYALAYGNSSVVTGATQQDGTVAGNVKGSIIYGNTGGDDLYANSVDGDPDEILLPAANIIGSSSAAGGAAINGAGTDVSGNPLLGRLQNNGGTLQTFKPGAGSPALGAGTSCDQLDELGNSRPSHGCDLGALELTLGAPIVTATAATDLTTTSAQLNGTVNPNGGATTFQFELRPETGTAPAVMLPSSPASAGAGLSTAAVSIVADGLQPGTTYQYELVATNSVGPTTSKGLAPAFTTLKTLTIGQEQTPAATKTVVGDQEVTLASPLPANCNSARGALPVRLSAMTLRSGTPVKLATASFFIDEGIAHRSRKRERVHGRLRTVVVTAYSPNAVVRKLPASLALSLHRIGTGRHALKVVLVYTANVVRDHRKVRVSASKTLRTTFRIC